MSDDPWISSHLELRGEQGEVLSGYGWIFPLGTGEVNLGVGTLATAKRPADLKVRRLMASYADQQRAAFGLGDELRAPTSALLPMGGAVSGVAGPNWALVGDAAACVNPLNGEGIDYGVEGGRLVAELMADDADLATAWPATLTHHYGESFSIARRLAGTGHRPARPGRHRSGRHAVRLDDDARPALDGQPGHRRGPRPRRPRLALGRPTLTRRGTPGRRSPDRMGRVPSRGSRAMPKSPAEAAARRGVRPDPPRRARSSSPAWPAASRPTRSGTCPAAALDHGENPRDALVREIREETGLDAEVGDTAHVYSAHLPSMWRQGRRWDYQALRIVYDAWVPADAPDAAGGGGRRLHGGRRLAPGRRRAAPGGLPVTDIVTEALADHQLVPDAADRRLRADPPRRRRCC